MSTIQQGAPPLKNMPTIFDFRLQSARRNLSDLRKFLDAIGERNEHLRQLHWAVVRDGSKIDSALGKLRNQILAAKGHLASPYGLEPKDINAAIIRAEEHLITLSGLLELAKGHAVEISVFQLDAEVLAPRNVEFSDKIEQGSIALDDIDEAAHKGNVEPPKFWNDLKAQGSLWVEYLDYLAGLSLRHDGLADGVCDIADGLIRQLQGKSEPNVFSIPGREGCVGVLPKVVYLRFPEWTVWAVPLAAHELWHIVESGTSYLKTGFDRRSDSDLNGRRPRADTPYWRMKDTEGFPGEDASAYSKRLVEAAHLSECLADAFATFTMGPAYACSSILLALDPLLATDQYRAHTIFRTLKRLNSGDVFAPFKSILANLSNLWEQAIQDAGTTLQLLPEDLEKWIDCLLDYLQPIPNVSFPIKEWPGRSDALIAYLNAENQNIETKDLSIRLVLAAAWQARIDSPQDFGEISPRCYELCTKILPNSGNKPPRDNPRFPNMQG